MAVEYQIIGGETYLGDGLYVAIDNGMVRLRTPRFAGGLRTPRFAGDHVIFLEPQVLTEFFRWLVAQGIEPKIST